MANKDLLAVSLACFGFGVVLRIPILGHFIWPFAVAGLGFKYFVTNSLLVFGHPLRKLFFNAFIRVEIFGLHRGWWAILTALAQVLTKWVNTATLMGVRFFLINKNFSQHAAPHQADGSWSDGEGPMVGGVVFSAV